MQIENIIRYFSGSRGLILKDYASKSIIKEKQLWKAKEANVQSYGKACVMAANTTQIGSRLTRRAERQTGSEIDRQVQR